MKKLISAFIIACILTSLSQPVSAAVIESPLERWVARYNGPGNTNDEASALVVDGSGNVYITGYSWGTGTGTDYATVKYDPDGNQLWVARYNGPGNDSDHAEALVVDNSGNAYVTGLSFGSGGYADYATIKYSPDGNELWVARYNGPGNGSDIAYALAVDNSGNVYVTGGSVGSGTSFDYATIKYSPDGNQLWVARYNGPGNNWDSAYALAVDNSGNVYVTGNSRGTSADYATIKYSPDGNQLWVARYNGPGNSYDYADALGVDNSGDVYVTGESLGSGTGFDYATIKYSPDGNELWVARYDGPGNSHDYAQDLAVDNSGNVYVTGDSVGNGTGNDYATVKYDHDGNQLWVARYNGDANSYDSARALAVDNSGNVYVTGIGNRDWNWDSKSDYATVKYSSEGNQLWVARYNGDTNWYDGARALAIDNSGNVYVTGYSMGDYTTIKYTQNASPVAIAGPNQTTYACLEEIVDVNLDGSASYDDNNDVLDYYWSWVIDGNLCEANGVAPTIQLPIGEHQIELVVHDGWVESEPDYCTVTVIEPLHAKLFCIPRVLNIQSRRRTIVAMLAMPQGILRSDIDQSEKLIFTPGDVIARRQYVFQWNKHGKPCTWVMAVFNKSDCMPYLSPGQNQVEATGKLNNGRYFQGRCNLKVMSPTPTRYRHR